MNCRKFEERLEDYLQGGLDFAGRFAVERHAQQCIDCGKEMADAQKLNQMVRRLNRVKAPVSFEASLLARIAEQRLKRRRRYSWLDWIYRFEYISWRNATAVAASLLVLAMGISMWQYLANRDRESSSDSALSRIQKGIAAAPASAEKPVDDADSGINAMNNASEPLNAMTPVDMASRQARTGYFGEPRIPPMLVEPEGSEYIEYIVPGPDDRQMIMRLPKTIRMRYAPPSEEYFIRNVSH